MKRGYNRNKSVGPALWTGLAAALLCGGCRQADPTAAYTSRGLYRTDIRTVCIEMFESQSFRRGLEYELTRAVAQQLELHTPFKIVSNQGKADTILYGRIEQVSERTLAQQRELDRPLANEVVVLVTVTWKDLRNGALIMDAEEIKVAGDYLVLLSAGRDSAAKQAINQLAVRIVEAMENTW